MDAAMFIAAIRPAVDGIAEGAVTGLIIAAPVFACQLYGLWRTRASFSGKQSREAMLHALRARHGKEW